MIEFMKLVEKKRLNLLNSLRKRDKMLSKPCILSLFSPTRLINSIKHEHSRKIRYVHLQAGHREQLYQSEEEKAAQENRRLKSEPSASATSSEPSRTSANISSSQHRHTNHDRKHTHTEKREHGERREDSEQKDQSERREAPAHLERRDIGPTGDGHPIKREPHAERRDFHERREDRKDIHDRRNTEIKGVFERKESEKKESSESRGRERRDNFDRKDLSHLEGKSALYKAEKRDGERKDTSERKDTDRVKGEFHDRKDIQVTERRDGLESKQHISEKKDSNSTKTSISQTNILSQNIKSESRLQTQHSAKLENLIPKSEKLEKLSQESESQSASPSISDTSVIPVSASMNPGVETVRPGMHKSKSESVLNYKDYLQRKERERQQSILIQKQNLSLNRTFTEGSKTHVHKQTNLDTSLPANVHGSVIKGNESKTENEGRPLKTLVDLKPHKSEVDVKPLPIKSEVDLKLRKTEIDVRPPGQDVSAKRRTEVETKQVDEKEIHVKRRNRSNSKSPGASKKSPRVHSNNLKISPVKSHTEPNARSLHLKMSKSENPPLKLQMPNNSNNNNNNSGPHPLSPALKSPVKNLREIPKSEPFVDLGEPLKLNSQEDSECEPGMESTKTESPIPKINIKQEPNYSNSADDTDVQHKPELTGIQPLKLHIKDLPDMANDISGVKSESPIPSLKISIKKEPGSGGNTPVKYKTEHSSNSTPLKLTIRQEPSNSSSPHEPLKIKLKASSSGYHHPGEKHHRHDPNRPEGHREHSGKHRHKHKSHKHKDKDRERKSSKHSVEEPGANGKPELKIRVKLGNPGANSSLSSESGLHRSSKHDKYKAREGANVLPEIVLNKNTNSEEHERHQPWSVTELLPKSSSKEMISNSPSRKRRRTPTVDDGSGHLTHSQQKAAKTNSHRLRRSSSSHSVVSMEMSDNECGEETGGVQNKSSNENQLKLIQKLQQAIQFQQKRVEDIKLQQQHSDYPGQKSLNPGYERQQSGFDVDLYCGNASVPPIPDGQPPLPPTPPPSQADNTPPPPPPR